MSILCLFFPPPGKNRHSLFSTPIIYPYKLRSVVWMQQISHYIVVKTRCIHIHLIVNSEGKSSSYLFLNPRELAYARASQVALMVKNPPTNAGDIKDVDSIPALERSLGGGNSNPQEYLCLEKPGAAQWATVHTIAKSWTQLNQLSMRVCKQLDKTVFLLFWNCSIISITLLQFFFFFFYF